VTWSTQQLADVAGVTLRSIRHWHSVGLLPEPERLSNGYKQYTSLHLVLVLRIARLANLGFTLEDIAAMLDSEERGRESLRGLRTEIDSRIAELVRIRAEIDELVRLGASPDLSPEALLAMEALGHDPVSRNVAIVLAHLVPKDDNLSFIETVKGAADEFAPINQAILELPDTADATEITALADRAVTAITEFYAEADVPTSVGDAATDRMHADTLTAVATEGMNGAQRRVMRLIVDGVFRGS